MPERVYHKGSCVEPAEEAFARYLAIFGARKATDRGNAEADDRHRRETEVTKDDLEKSTSKAYSKQDTSKTPSSACIPCDRHTTDVRANKELTRLESRASEQDQAARWTLEVKSRPILNKASSFGGGLLFIPKLDRAVAPFFAFSL